MPTQPNRMLPPPVLGDPLLDDRLARLNSRRAAAGGPKHTGGPNRTTTGTTNRTTASGTRTPPRVPGTAKAAAPRRRHPAKGSRAAALVMSIGTTAGLTAYFYQADSSAASGTTTPASALQASVVLPATTAAAQVVPAQTTAAAAGTPASTAAAPAANALADGTFIGQTFTNRWGPVQVQVTVSGGQITDVAALQTPGGRSQSVQINDYATPMLRTEALTAQSADIHTVSGATYTSNSYRKSLQSALDVAKAQATVNAG